jgi:hypothetical protein
MSEKIRRMMDTVELQVESKGVMMVCNTQNYWVSWLCPSSTFLNTIKTTFQKLDLFLSSGEGKGTPTLGPLERANLNHIGPAIEVSPSMGPNRGACGSVVVKALCYKPEGRGFDSR